MRKLIISALMLMFATVAVGQHATREVFTLDSAPSGVCTVKVPGSLYVYENPAGTLTFYSCQSSTWQSTTTAQAAGRVFVETNVVIDTDEDGDPDTVWLADYDNDGTLEMVDDIQAAIDALTDTGPKHVYVLPGSYAAPATDVGGHTVAIVELPSNTTLTCLGGAILNGFPSTVLASAPATDAALGWDGADDIIVQGCTIDGGMAESDADRSAVNAGGAARMGIHAKDSARYKIINNTVKNTGHTCLYTKDSTDLIMSGNTLFKCGNWHGSGGTDFQQPGIYLFADGTKGTTERFVISDNVINKTGGQGINTRSEGADDQIRNGLVSGNIITEVGNPSIQTRYDCLSIRGTDDTLFSNNTCANVYGGFNIVQGAGWWDDASADTTSSYRITIDGLVVSDYEMYCGIIGRYADSPTIQNIVCNATSDSGTHTGADNAAVLTDSVPNWGANTLIGFIVNNTTDTSSCTITANTATTVTCTLAGGVEDDWDTTDVYSVTPPLTADGFLFELPHRRPIMRNVSIFDVTDKAFSFSDAGTYTDLDIDGVYIDGGDQVFYSTNAITNSTFKNFKVYNTTDTFSGAVRLGAAVTDSVFDNWYFDRAGINGSIFRIDHTDSARNTFSNFSADNFGTSNVNYMIWLSAASVCDECQFTNLTMRRGTGTIVGGAIDLNGSTDSVVTNVSCSTHSGDCVDADDTVNLRIANVQCSGASCLGLGGTPSNAEVVNVEGFSDRMERSIYIKEQASASASIAAYAQLWTKTATPNELWWTDDDGTDVQLGVGGSERRSYHWDSRDMGMDGAQCGAAILTTINSGPRVYAINCTDNDASTLYGMVVMPDGWDGSTVTFELGVVQTAADTSALHGDVTAMCRAAAETVNNTWGAEINMDDLAVTGSNAFDTIPSAGGVTPDGTCAGGDALFWRWQVDAGGTETAMATVEIIWMKMEYVSSGGD